MSTLGWPVTFESVFDSRGMHSDKNTKSGTVLSLCAGSLGTAMLFKMQTNKNLGF